MSVADPRFNISVSPKFKKLHILRGHSPKYDAVATNLVTKIVYLWGEYSAALYFVTFPKCKELHILRGHSPKYDAVATNLVTKIVFLWGEYSAALYFVTFPK